MIQYCPNCGTKITAESRFCPVCGSALSSNKGIRGTQRGSVGNKSGNNMTRNPSRNRSGYYSGDTGNGSSSDVGAIVIRVISGILGIAFLIQGILRLFGGVRGYGYIHVFFNNLRNYLNPFSIVCTIIVQLLSPIHGLAIILFALLFGVVAWKYTSDHVDEYVAMLSLGSLIPIGVYLILLLLTLLSGWFYVSPMIFVKNFFFPVLAVLLIFVLFTVFVRQPFINKDQEEVKKTFGNVIGFLKEEVPFLSRSKPKTRRAVNTGRQDAGYTAADYFANQENNGSQAAGATYNNGGGQGYYDESQLHLAEPLREDRSIWLYILFNLLTCGFYKYYFVYSMARDVNVCCEGDNDNTPGLLVYYLLGVITCGIYNLWWLYKLGNRLQSNAPRYGIMFTENGSSVLLWQLFGSLLCGIGYFIGTNILIKNTNTICRLYNETHGLS